jgi:NADPH2:quinone reductase
VQVEGIAARGLIVDGFGDWRNTRLGPLALRPPGAGEVLLKAEAASLNFPDMLMIEGKYQHRPKPPFTPGRDVAGTVLAVGADVTDFAPGDRVMAQAHEGAFATHTLARCHSCLRIPPTLSFVDAAAAGTVLATVVVALGLRARLVPGKWVLITGAAGGVGTAAIQYARWRGARVAALVSSAEKAAACRALGAEIVLRSDEIGDLRDGLRAALFAHAPDGADVVLDVVGGDVFDAAIRCVRPGGRCLVVGFTSGRIPTIATNYLLLKDIALIGCTLARMFTGTDSEFHRLLAESFTALAEGRIRIPVEACYRLEDFAMAMARIAERQVVGKVVLAPLQ